MLKIQTREEPCYGAHCTVGTVTVVPSLFAALKRIVLGREDACRISWISGVAVWVYFRCRLGGRKLHMLFAFPCKLILNLVPPHLKYHCDLGAV